MKIAQLSNSNLLARFEIACFNITNYPSNKAKADEFHKLEREIAHRLGMTDEELEAECRYI